ncbi:hypothetical protein [Hymenobacter canadensis]|uniref:Uncharacterized protein n=1 Tax=Hymenobacter canadensis TaxID=2999067 RepID=A0ABY7LUR4_9BACT|nr:hypothetical protein [Hymenobacter canadensis]WBA44135.1 hypothetical protein O3303_19795 [Hymenobacter canadensis]
MERHTSCVTSWLVWSLLLCSCDKTTPDPELELPPITAIGANTLGFEVDGRVWINFGRGCYGSGGGGCFDNVLRAYSRTYQGVRRFSISAGLITPRHQESFALTIDTLRGTGTYISRSPPPSYPIGAVSTGANGITLTESRRARESFVSRANATRIVLTRVDTVRRIVSGTFEGRLENGFSPGSFVTIQNGRFDVTY